jgi:hypothetical protein
MAADTIMVDIIEAGIITTVDTDIDLDIIITMVTDIIMGVGIELLPDGMDIIGIEMTTITAVDIETVVETIITIGVITTTEVITTIGAITTTEVITTELPDHVQRVDNIDRSFSGLSSFMRGSIILRYSLKFSQPSIPQKYQQYNPSLP